MSESKFTPKPGQVDYTNIRYAPVINTVVIKDGKVLLVQRNPKMQLYPSYWNGISGFLDDNQSIEEKVKNELNEELGIKPADIIKINRGRPLLQEAPEYKKTWLVTPVLAEIKTDQYKLDWESQKAAWFSPKEALRLKLLPGFDSVLREFFKV